MATGTVVAQHPQNLSRAKLKDDIFAKWFHRLENKYYIGERLWQLQQLDSKAGSGTFLEDLFELSIPTTTAYRVTSSLTKD